MTKQAAAKTVTALEERGYLARAPDPGDASASTSPHMGAR
ncbi:MarR family transcriptional regulator [Kineosporia mesophila]|nr:helix-turn-helix domain-containing protein [Kineosporia mesophila]MCD5354066.1 MarR family transcriptional regulator [Kineosporia mesophila]